MRIRIAGIAVTLAAATVTAGTVMTSNAYAANHVSSQEYRFYPGGGAGSTRTGEIDFIVTTTRDGKGKLVDVKATLSGHNNMQGQALGIKMDFTQPYVKKGESGRYHVQGKVVLQACIAKKLPVCGPSGTVTFSDVVNMYGPQSPATATSSNPRVWPIYTSP
ncbi:hypothetical protein [Streptomyces sp. NPDC096152]|uniref:hypothetical protein n=1 Tax=Streptomyces sp. NPDC096152 TaxID=3366078 RepID=UPI00381EABF6